MCKSADRSLEGPKLICRERGGSLRGQEEKGREGGNPRAAGLRRENWERRKPNAEFSKM